MKKTENPRVIHEFEGGPVCLFWENSLLFGPDYKSEDTKPIVLHACEDHSVFREHNITPTLEAVAWKKIELGVACEECEECNEETCPKSIEEVGQKGSGMQLSETLEGWVIDLSKCTSSIKTIDIAKEGILLPCKPGVCQECAVDHEPEMPHNQQSLYYQYKFYQQNGRWPTWEDAMAHCSPELQAWWKKELRERGVSI